MVFDEGRFSHVNGQFADIGNVITNAFKVLRNKQQSRVSSRRMRLRDHQFDQTMENMVVEIVDLLIALDYFTSGIRVSRCKGVKRLVA